MKTYNRDDNLFKNYHRFIFAFIVTLILIFVPQIKGIAQVPNIEWQKTFGGSSSDEAECILQTIDGGYIFAGWTYSNDFDVVGSHAGSTSDCWVVKTDPTGNIQWQKPIGGTQYDDAVTIKQTTDGGYIIAGHSMSNDGDIPDNYVNSYDAIVVKLDQMGNIQWSKNFGGTDYDVIISIDLTSDGGYICAGYTGSNNIDVSGNHGDLDAWIVKLDQNGSLQWQKCIGGTDRDVAWSIKQANDGGYVFTGHTRSSNGDIPLNHGNWDIIVCKLTASGNIQWLKTFGGSGEENASKINCTADGGYIIAGYSFSSNGDVTTNFGQNDIWIFKLDNAGNLQWQKSYGGSDYEDPYSMEFTTDGGYIVAGRTRSTNGDISVNNGGNDYWIVKLDVNGVIQWEKSLGGTQQDIGHSVKQTLDGGFIVAGTSYSSDGDVSYNHGLSDIWIVKLGNCTLNIPGIPGNITGNLSPCYGIVTTYSIDTVNYATGYTWTFPPGWIINSGQGTSQIIVTVGANAGTISVLAYNSCKSSANRTISVTSVIEQPPQIVIASNMGNQVCDGAPVIFTAQTAGASSPIYQWKKNGNPVGSNNIMYTDNAILNADVITCTITSNSSCLLSQSATSNSIAMSVFHPPVISLDKTNTLCTQSSRILDAGIHNSYSWNDGSTGRTLTVTGLGIYYVTVTDNNGCIGSDTANITTMLPLPKDFLPPDTSICSYGTISLNAKPGYKDYLWNTNSFTRSIEIASPGLYWLDVTDDNNCKGRDTIKVIPKQCLKGFFVPTAFTPNNDTKNDFFKPLIFGNIKKFKFSIYDRYGQLIFQTTDVANGWNGNIKGMKQNSNVFVWTCTYQFEGELEEFKKGTVLLLR